LGVEQIEAANNKIMADYRERFLGLVARFMQAHNSGVELDVAESEMLLVVETHHISQEYQRDPTAPVITGKLQYDRDDYMGAWNGPEFQLMLIDQLEFWRDWKPV